MLRCARKLLLALLAWCIATPAFVQADVANLIKKPILDRYLEKYVALSEAQRIAIDGLHKSYLKNWSEHFDREIADFNTKWEIPFHDAGNPEARNTAAAFEETKKAADRLRFRLRSANDQFFDEVEALLTEDQLKHFQRVRLAHERHSNHRGRQGGLRERHVDPIDLAEQLQLHDTDRKLRESVILVLEPMFVQALQMNAAANMDYLAAGFVVADIARQTPPGEAPDPDVQQAIDAVLERRGKAFYGSDRRLVEIIRQVVRELKQSLSPAAASELQRQFNEVCYPEVFPDPTHAAPAYEAALELPGLDEDRRAAMVNMLDQYVAEHAQLSDKMAKELFDLSVITVRAEPNYMERGEDRRNDYRVLSDRREKLNLAQPARIRALLTPEENLLLPAWKYEKEPPPKRWDPGTSAMRPPGNPRRAATQPATRPDE